MTEVKTVPQVEAEEADWVICARRGDWPDLPRGSSTGTCSKCLEEIIFKTDGPKKPPKICWECALELPDLTDGPMVASEQSSPQFREMMSNFLTMFKTKH